MLNTKPRTAVELNQLASMLHSAEARGVQVDRLDGSKGVIVYPYRKSILTGAYYTQDCEVVSVNAVCAAINNLV